MQAKIQISRPLTRIKSGAGRCDSIIEIFLVGVGAYPK
tara:strand:- start:3992 stop:4105 length:114 start_codon:yes stop_codon:yes gene_type:complete